MNSIEQCIVERARHEQELQNGWKRLNERKLQIQECKVQKVKALDASSGDNDCSRIVSDKENDQGLENQGNTSGDESSMSRNECNDKSNYGYDTDIRPSYDTTPMVEVPYTAEYNVFVVDTQHSEQPECIINTCTVEKDDSNVIPDSPDMCDNDIQTDQKCYRIELVDQAWVKHSKDHFCAPTAKDMEILIKTCLMPLALKTQNDSFAFVHELKKEMHADLKYVESLENEIDELESDKHSLSDLDAHTELQCLYLHKVKECECLTQKLSKQTEFVSKEVYIELLRSFAKLEKHSISLELTLQQCQKQMKNDIVCKEKASNVFQKEREQYFEIQDLKAQLQDKNIAICEFKKLIEKMKVRKSSFAKPYDVNAPSPSRNSPKHVSFQSPRESVGSNDMVHNYYLEEAKKKVQLQKDKALNTKPSVQQYARLPNTANGNKLKPRNFNQQPRNWRPSMSSRVSNRTVNTIEPPRNQKTFLKSKDLACPT
ncbi:hypothetical protein Tco_0290434 [Tanacetum coccineum]